MPSGTTKKRIGIFVIAYNAVNKLDWTLDRIPKEVWNKVDEVLLQQIPFVRTLRSQYRSSFLSFHRAAAT